MNMLILRPTPGDAYDWLLCGPDGETLQGPGRDAAGAIQAKLQAERKKDEKPRILVLAPADDVLLRELRFHPRERRHILSTVPFALEDQLIEDAGAMHFATDQPKSDQVHVAIVRVQRMREWMQPLADCGMRAVLMAPEQQALAMDPACWHGWYDEGRLVIRTGEHSGVGVSGGALPLALQLLLSDDQENQKIRVATASKEQFDLLVEQVPKDLRSHLEPGDCEPLGYAAKTFRRSGDCINMLQGAFSSALPWRDWLRRWRWPLAPVAAALALQFTFLLADRLFEQREHTALRQATEAIYGELFPGSPMPSDLRGYLSSRLSAEASNEPSGATFTDLISRVGQAAEQIKDVQLTNLSYDSQNGEMRIDMLVPGFDTVTALRDRLAGSRVNAKLLNSSAQRGGGVRAQLLCSNG